MLLPWPLPPAGFMPRRLCNYFAVTMFPGSSWFPTSVPLLCTFVAHLISTGLAPTSVTSRMSAIAFFHKLFRLPDPTGDFFVRRLLLSAYKQLDTIDVRFPITLPILHQLCASSGHVTQSAYYACLLRAIYLLMFHAFLRIGEVTRSRNNLRFSQVSVLSDSCDSSQIQRMGRWKSVFLPS